MTTILIVDDHPALRLAFRTHFSSLMGVRQVHETDNGQSAIDLVRQHTPDLVVLDLDIPRVSGLEAMPRILAAHPGVRVLVVTAQDPIPFAARSRHAGAQGFVSKTEELEAIARCVDIVRGGFTVFPASPPRETPHPGQTVTDEERLHKLSDKEVEILRMLSRGLSNKDIGKALFVSNKTISSYKIRIMNKLGAESLVDLVDFARRYHLIP